MSNGYLPGLGIATGLFEITLAAWALSGPGRRHIVRPVALLLVLLAGYQFAEVWICQAPSSSFNMRLAFADIVWLPPLGVWLVATIEGGSNARMRQAAHVFFGFAGLLTAWVFLDPSFGHRTVCNVVVARYYNESPFYSVYGGFYQVGLMAMIIGASLGMAVSNDSTTRHHLADVQLGTLGFVLPSMMVQLLVPSLIGTMPSVMCHFALVLAIFLGRLLARERRVADEETSPPRLVSAH